MAAICCRSWTGLGTIDDGKLAGSHLIKQHFCGTCDPMAEGRIALHLGRARAVVFTPDSLLV